jgi:murein DD-endopeptidase MepM/ murein hydrolase activator NlpD
VILKMGWIPLAFVAGLLLVPVVLSGSGLLGAHSASSSPVAAVLLRPGDLLCPVPGAVVTQGFGPSSLLGEPALFGFAHFHAGVDLAIAAGTPIRAAEGGQVVQAEGQVDSLGLLVGYGNLVRIASAALDRIDYYGHLSAFAVSRGVTVHAGDIVGFVGTTGYSTGPHVHFEVRSNGTPVDPAPFMGSC